MMASVQANRSFFRKPQGPSVDDEATRLLMEVDARFDQPELLTELRWRLDVLHTLANQRELQEECQALRDRLTQIFTLHDDPDALLREVKSVTSIAVEGRDPIDLRYFLLHERRRYKEPEYRDALARKIENTLYQCDNLVTCYPDAAQPLGQLRRLMEGLAGKMLSPRVSTAALKGMEDHVRETMAFTLYEDLKERLLKDWLARFAGVSEQQLAQLDPEEVARLIQEHQRHSITQLATAGIHVADLDVTDYLSLHDTLEGSFREEGFWELANAATKRGFNEWVLRVVQAMGLTDGRRHVLVQSEATPENYLLLGLGLPELPRPEEGVIRLVPYAKPFTRKAGYLLEVRRRALGDDAAYYRELRHYMLPFLFGFDQVRGLEVPAPLREFFNRAY